MNFVFIESLDKKFEFLFKNKIKTSIQKLWLKLKWVLMYLKWARLFKILLQALPCFSIQIDSWLCSSSLRNTRLMASLTIYPKGLRGKPIGIDQWYMTSMSLKCFLNTFSTPELIARKSSIDLVFMKRDLVWV